MANLVVSRGSGIGQLAINFVVVVILLPLFAVVSFALTSYISDGLIAVLPFNEVATGKLLFAVRAVLIALATSFLYFFLSDFFNRQLCGASSIGLQLQEKNQPWLFVGPALILILLFLVFPALQTLWLSFVNDIPVFDEGGEAILNDAGQTVTERGFVWFANYIHLITSEDFWFAMRNSVLWLMVVPTTCITMGMIIAVVSDRLSWGTVAKSLIFVPLAISFVGAAVIWRNIYAGGGTETYEVGMLNALLTPLGVKAQFWYEVNFWGNFFMMFIMIWIQTGFAMVLFSAALRGVSEETIEAARIDGANEFQIFFRVTLPQVYGTIIVVWTTLLILVLKVFDIPYALTANKPDKLLLATLMEQTRTAQREDEIAAAVAIILMLTIIPIMLFNVWRFRRESQS